MQTPRSSPNVLTLPATVTDSPTPVVTYFQEKVVKHLETLKATQEQHSVMLEEILRTVKTKNVEALSLPTDTPQ